MATEKSSAQNWCEDNFQRFEGVLNGATQLPLHQLRRKGIEEFQRQGFPTTKNESWKYTSLAELGGVNFVVGSLLPQASISASDLEKAVFTSCCDHRIVLVNGAFHPSLSTALPAGVEFISLREALRAPESELGKAVIAQLEEKRDGEDDSLTALGQAFLSDGAVIRVAGNKEIPEPVLILSIVSGAGQPAAINFRNVIFVGPRARLNVVCESIILGGKQAFSNSRSDVVVGAEGQCSVLKLVRENAQSIHVDRLYATQAEKSDFQSLVCTVSGGTVRNEVCPRVEGEHCQTRLFGVTVGAGNEHIDNTTVLDHAEPSCESTELYKGVYSGKSRGAFSGTIIVRPDAQKTNAFQKSNSILLSEEAIVDTRPQLKIWADDVRCTHGATVGQLDDEAMFYLRSRGVPRAEAQAMLIRAFLHDVVQHVSSPRLSKALDRVIEEKLSEIEAAS